MPVFSSESLISQPLQALEKVRKLLPKGKFSRGVAVLAGGNAVGQFLTIAASPLLTRLYTPEEMGVLAVYISITAILTVVLSLRYETAVALPESDKEALAIVKLALYVVVFVSLSLGALVIGTRNYIATYLNVPELATYLFLIPISGVLIGWFMVFRVWCVRVHEFPLVGKARIKQVVSSLVIQIAASPFGALALIGGQLANQGAGTLSLGKKAISHPDMLQVTYRDMSVAAVRYKKFPLVNTWSSLLNRISLQFPTLFFAAIFGPAAAGIYALANRTLKAPSAAVNSAINSVFLTAAAEAWNKGDLRPVIVETHRYLAMAVFPFLLLVSLIAPQLFTLVFGREWEDAGDYAQWMTLLVYCTLVVSPFMGLFAVLEKQGLGLVFQVLLFLVRLLALYLGSQVGDAVYTVMLFSVFSAIVYFLVLIWVGSLVDGGVVSVLQQSLIAMFWAFLLCSPVVCALLVYANTAYFWATTVLSTVFCTIHLYKTLRRKAKLTPS